MITLIKTVRTVAGDKAKTLVLPIALSCADSLLHMGMFAVMIAAIINLVAGAFNAELLAFYSGALVVLFVVRAALYATNYAQTQFRGADITADLRLSIGNHLRRLNLGYFDKNSIGQLASVLTTDVSDFEQTITTSLASFFKVVCFSVLACAFAFAINWLYGLIILAIVVASLPLARLGGRAASKGGVRYRESVHAVISRIIEYINGIKTFKLYNLTGRRFERLDRSFADLKRESIRMELSIMPFSVLFSVATSLIVPLGLVAGTLMFMDGQLDAPRLIAAVMIAVSISSMMTTLGVIYPELNYLAKAAEGIERIQAERPLAYRDGNPRFTSFDVRFDDVRFGYADGKEVLHGVTFTAQPGTRTALVGPSGSGKTTVISLISRFWDASSGSVRVGGHEVRDIAPDALAEQVAVVFQDVYLLADTVANNIRVGKPDATQEEVEAAARAAHCHDFIEALPQGYDTLVGEGGSTLSGGEKQRISIARALIKNAPIVLLDESTSSLDEAAIAALRRYLLDAKAQGAAVLVAEHRLWWLADVADEVVVMEEGRIARRFDGATFRALPSSEVRDLGLRVRALADERARERRAPGDAREPRAPLVRLRGVHASYGKREVLHGVDLDLREGEVAALVGANGAGKSTLCRTIVGLHRESAGTTTIDGEPAGPKQRLRACSMVFQDVNYQLFADSVRTEVSFGLTDAEAPDAARVDEVLDGLGLAAYAERHPATLSGGQKQRLAVAACIATGKRLLVFDEPTSGLDLGSMRTVAALVRRLADEGRAVLVVTHDLEFIGQACDKAVRVEAGRIAAEAVVEGDLQAVRELLAKG